MRGGNYIEKNIIKIFCILFILFFSCGPVAATYGKLQRFKMNQKAWKTALGLRYPVQGKDEDEYRANETE